MVSGSHKPSSMPPLPHGPIWVTSLPLSRGALPASPRLPPLTAAAWDGAAHPSVPGVGPSLVPAVLPAVGPQGAGVGGRKKAGTNEKTDWLSKCIHSPCRTSFTHHDPLCTRSAGHKFPFQERPEARWSHHW